MARCEHPEGQARTLFPSTDYVSGERFEVRLCGACGLARTAPCPPADRLAGYYPPEYYGAPGRRRFPGPVEAAQKLLYGWRARRVERLLGRGGGEVLDVGCGPGFLLDAFRSRGWRATGTELSEASARRAREGLGLEVHVGSLPELGLQAGRFDAAVLWHVLEHVPEPEAMLAAVQRVLKPGGVLLVSVPNFGSLEARASRGGWFHLDVPRHLVHFTPQVLAAALAGAGFEAAGTSWFAPEFDAFSFVQSVENRLGLPQNLLYGRLRRRGARLAEAGAGGLQVALAFLLAAPLGLLALGATTLSSLAGSGSTLSVYARKR